MGERQYNLDYRLNDGTYGTIRMSASKRTHYGDNTGQSKAQVANVFVNKNNKKYGVRARYGLYARKIGTDTDSATKYIRIPVYTQAGLSTLPASIEYKGFTYELVKGIEEDAN